MGEAHTTLAGNCPEKEITQGVFPSRLAGKILTSSGTGKQLSRWRCPCAHVLWAGCGTAWNLGPGQPTLPDTNTQGAPVLGWTLQTASLMPARPPRQGLAGVRQFIWGWPGAQRVLANMTWFLGPSSVLCSIPLCPKSLPWLQPWSSGD